jgi:starch phosphorylase
MKNHIEQFTQSARVAYLTMEIALQPAMKTYSGGLGILAGDMARSCADLELPVVFVSLASRAGYVMQKIDTAGRQFDYPDPWEPAKWAQPLGAKIAVEIEGAEVWIRPWLYRLMSPLGHTNAVLLLDSDLEENSAEDRRITDHLYGGDDAYRLKQEVVLGIGGHRILRALGFDIKTYHLNEGHAALLAVDLLRRLPRSSVEVMPGECTYDVARVRDQCVFTSHTPVEAGHDQFSYSLAARVLDGLIEIDQLKILAGTESLNMTRLALNLSGYVNGVAERHARTTRALFPGYRVHAISNGVHGPTWAAPSVARLYQARFPNWAHEPEVLVRAAQIDDGAVWAAHQEAKSQLIERVRDIAGVNMATDVPLIAFARRMTGYKRPTLLFTDTDRLIAIHRRYPFQLVLAGVAHPKDEHGKQLIQEIHGHMRQLGSILPMAYLPNYTMMEARVMVAGADIWLNTPRPPFEASGTSGMKAALNGVLNLSVLDGWWAEACIEGATGWAIGQDGASRSDEEDAQSLYDKLETVVLPLYYRDRSRWVWMMKETISKIAYYFNSQRAMRRYAAEAYLR